MLKAEEKEGEIQNSLGMQWVVIVLIFVFRILKFENEGEIIC